MASYRACEMLARLSVLPPGAAEPALKGVIATQDAVRANLYRALGTRALSGTGKDVLSVQSILGHGTRAAKMRQGTNVSQGANLWPFGSLCLVVVGLPGLW